MKVFGHERERGLLRNAILRSRLPHTLLFSGPEAVGKRMVALELAKDLLSQNETRETESRALIERGEHPDLHVLSIQEGKRDISVEQARELISSLQLRPYLGTKRVAIIDNAHDLSTPAQNALLLTLEEPPSDCVIILISHLPHRLLPTILSRSQEVSFGLLTKESLHEILATIAPEMKRVPSTLSGSLAPLSLFQFRVGAALPLATSKAVTAHLAEYEDRIREIAGTVSKGLNGQTAAEVLNAASELSDKSLSHDEIFQTIFSQLRESLLSPSTDDTARKATALFKALDTEQLISERNLSAPLQLSTLLLSLQR